MKSLKQHLNEKKKQKYLSDETSQNQLAAGFKKIKWQPGDVNLDYGGGKYEKATLWMLQQGCTNLVYDIGNRDDGHNAMVLKLAVEAKTTTCFNVLNVIMEPEIRRIVIKDCKRQKTETIYFSAYEGNKSGEGAESKGKKRSWQNNLKLKEYLDEVKAVFPSSKISKDMIIATV